MPHTCKRFLKSCSVQSDIWMTMLMCTWRSWIPGDPVGPQGPGGSGSPSELCAAGSPDGPEAQQDLRNQRVPYQEDHLNHQEDHLHQQEGHFYHHEDYLWCSPIKTTVIIVSSSRKTSATRGSLLRRTNIIWVTSTRRTITTRVHLPG